MGELPTLVRDLAYILIVAGAVTIVFKRLRQPLVLGYIVAGFLAGPHMPYKMDLILIQSNIVPLHLIGICNIELCHFRFLHNRGISNHHIYPILEPLMYLLIYKNQILDYTT